MLISLCGYLRNFIYFCIKKYVNMATVGGTFSAPPISLILSGPYDCWLTVFASLCLRAFFFSTTAARSAHSYTVDQKCWEISIYQPMTVGDICITIPQLLCFSVKISIWLDYAIFWFPLWNYLWLPTMIAGLTIRINSLSSLYHFPHSLAGVPCTSQ